MRDERDAAVCRDDEPEADYAKIGSLLLGVSALGDRLSTWKSSFILAAAITVSGVLLFHYLLQIPMPVLEWRL